MSQASGFSFRPKDRLSNHRPFRTRAPSASCWPREIRDPCAQSHLPCTTSPPLTGRAQEMASLPRRVPKHPATSSRRSSTLRRLRSTILRPSRGGYAEPVSRRIRPGSDVHEAAMENPSGARAAAAAVGTTASAPPAPSEKVKGGPCNTPQELEEASTFFLVRATTGVG